MKIGVPLECIRCKTLLMFFDAHLDTFECFGCKLVITLEFMADQMGMTRGAFTTLLAPGLAAAMRNAHTAYPGKVWLSDDDEIREIERADEMAILHPDTSKVPIWRRRPTRVEHPMTAWRAWGLELVWFDDFYDRHSGKKGVHVENIEAYLTSVAAECRWEGPVLRAHKRPVDPKYWDAVKHLKETDYETYREELNDTFHLAGVWSVKTRDQAEDVAHAYGVAVYGKIKMWGRVAQFKLGYRAEACMIDELFVQRRQLHRMFNSRNDARDADMILARIDQIVKSLERRYGCQVNLV